jgi:thiol:disulfide interchange protein DsbD
LPGGVVLLGLALAAVLGLAAAMRPGTAPPSPSAQGPGIDWQPWSPAARRAAQAAGRPVFVDFTAAWCITCQVNKRVALDSAAVAARFDTLDVLALRADWTRYDPAITQALAGFGRSGVPLYVYYPPDAPAQLLPAVLTPGAVLEALAR